MSDSNGSAPSATPVWQLGDADLLLATQEREQLICRLQAEQYAQVAEIHARGLALEHGYRRVERFLSELLNISQPDAKKRVRRGVALTPRRELSGAITPPVAPALAKAASEGAVGAEHLDVVLDVLAKIPDHTSSEGRAVCEKALADYARVAPPVAVGKLGVEVLARVDPDGTLPTDKDLTRPDRELITSWTRGGHLAIRGRLDAETARKLETVLSPLTKPRPAEDGTPDDRSVAERNGDALAEMLDLVLREDGLPTEAGVRPTVTVVLDFNKLLEGVRSAALLNGTDPITAEQARRLACDADIVPAVLGTHGEVLDLGRTQRLVNRAQRRALNLRDGGCTFPGCPKPARWTQAHHIKFWLHGGPTDLANLCLLCAAHHTLIHHSEWRIVMADDGHPDFIPPAWIDPEQKPRRNYAHHHP